MPVPEKLHMKEWGVHTSIELFLIGFRYILHTSMTIELFWIARIETEQDKGLARCDTGKVLRIIGYKGLIEQCSS